MYIRPLRIHIGSVLAVLIFLAGWELTARSGVVNMYLFPPPSEVAIAWLDWARTPDFWMDLGSSSWRLGTGYMLGALSGVLFGVATGRMPVFSRFCSPIIQLFRPLPPVAIIPLVIVWFGIGDAAKIFSIAFAVFFPVWVSAHIGALQIPEDYIRAARILRISGWSVWLRVLLPAALPYILSGCRTAIATGFIMIYVTELAGASSGIGYRINLTYLAYRIDSMIAVLATLAGLGALSDAVFAYSTRKLFPWLALSSD